MKQRITVPKEQRIKAVADYLLHDIMTVEEVAEKYKTTPRNFNNWLSVISSNKQDSKAVGKAMHDLVIEEKLEPYYSDLMKKK